jgi:hypothetical protein
VFRAFTILGALLVVAAGVVAAGDSDGLSQRLPTQVPPRRVALYPLIAGALLLTLGLIGSLFP